MWSSFFQLFSFATQFDSEIYLSTQRIFFRNANKRCCVTLQAQIKHIDKGELKKAHKKCDQKLVLVNHRSWVSKDEVYLFGFQREGINDKLRALALPDNSNSELR